MIRSMASERVAPSALIGPLSVDRYVVEGIDLPGGGALNMAYHWAARVVPFELFARVGDDRARLFTDFCRRHGIEATDELVVAGTSSSIDIEIRGDRQPWMDHFVEGVAADFALSPRELARIGASSAAHLVLVDVVAAELDRVGSGLRSAGVRLSGDFLDARHITSERFAVTAGLLDLAFVGWPGAIDDDSITEMASICDETRTIGVFTFGAAGILVADGRTGDRRVFDVDGREVAGTTIGCGDAFIAAFLAEWHRTGDLDASIDAGRRLGAAATEWRRPLPDDAYV